MPWEAGVPALPQTPWTARMSCFPFLDLHLLSCEMKEQDQMISALLPALIQCRDLVWVGRLGRALGWCLEAVQDEWVRG